MSIRVAVKAFVIYQPEKVWFYQEEMRFLGYIVSHQVIQMEEE